jgi:hypothetical protein
MAQVWTPYGLISGLLFVLANLSSYVAINLLDNVAAATGLWCGFAIVVSFVVGALTEGIHHSILLAIAAIGLMLLGVSGITHTQTRSSMCDFHGMCMTRNCVHICTMCQPPSHGPSAAKLVIAA